MNDPGWRLIYDKISRGRTLRNIAAGSFFRKKSNLGIGLALLMFFGLAANVWASPAERSNEVTPLVSFYKGDTLRNSILGGLSYTYHINLNWWVGASFLGGTLAIDEPNGTALKNGDNLFTVDATVYFNIPALIGVTKPEDKGRVADIYVSLGGGHMWMGSVKTPYGALGGGMVLFPGYTWLAVRFDVKNLMYGLENTGGSDFNTDLAFSVGPSFFF